MNRDRRPTKEPKKKYNSFKVSDRRMAASFRPSKYLHGQNASSSLNSELEKIKTSNDMDKSSESSSSVAISRYDPKTGRIWHDKTLTEWNPNHFRLFVGNVGNDVDEDLLINTFIKYSSLSKVKIPKDDGKSENKGFAFISFANPDDYLKCYKEMNGKYVGSKPITLERAKTEIGDVVKVQNKNKNKNKKISNNKYRQI